jgi:hypothetical protein
MIRSESERLADVRRLLGASRAVYRDRERFLPELVRSTGLTPQGVLFGFECLEREATDAELVALVATAGDAPQVHVILSANVFVAPLRALALARAAAPRVTVRPSSRDPTLPRALVAAAADPSIELGEERDVGSIDCGEIHVYGRHETLAAVRERARAGIVVRGHGPGMGVAVVTHKALAEDAAESIARDVVAFDQRGCLSPRVVLVEPEPGSVDMRTERVAAALHERLCAWHERVPRGELSDAEKAAARLWRETMGFVGRIWSGPGHLVACAPWRATSAIPALPPAGRHVLVVEMPALDAMAADLAGVAPHVVAVGTDDPSRVRPFAPPHARLAILGRMQQPALDGPVDRRA